MNHFGVGGKVGEAAGYAVVKAHPQGDQQVGLVDGQAGVSHAVHSGHSDMEQVVGGERADAQEGGDDRYLGFFRQRFQFGVGVGDEDAVARQDEGAAGGVNQVASLGNLEVISRAGGIVAGQVEAVGPDKGHPVASQHIFGDVEQHRAGAAGAGDVKGFLDGRGDVLDFHNQHIVLGDGEGNAGDVGFLKGVAADGGARHLAGDGDHRDGVHHRAGNAGGQVGGAGAGGGGADADFAGGPGVAVGGHGGGLFVADQDVAQLGVAAEGAVKGQHRAAGQAENNIHSFLEQAFTDDFRAGQFHQFSSSADNSHRAKQRPVPLKGRA